MNVEGCAGQCCAVFYFPKTPRQIKTFIEEVGPYNGLDGMMIADMLVPLTVEEAEGRIERFGLSAAALQWPDGGWPEGHLFTCRHWDEDTRLCGVYDHRPDMCSKYPYGRECGHCKVAGGCSYGA